MTEDTSSPSDLRSLSAEERFDATLRAIVATESLWSLRRPDGWALFEAEDGRGLLPVWPEPELAMLFASGQWADAVPEELELRTFLDHWVTGLSGDGRAVVVCPVPEDEGLQLEPEEFGEELLLLLMPEE